MGVNVLLATAPDLNLVIKNSANFLRKMSLIHYTLSTKTGLGTAEISSKALIAIFMKDNELSAIFLQRGIVSCFRLRKLVRDRRGV